MPILPSLDLFENGKPRTTDPKRAEVIQNVYNRNTKALKNLFLEGEDSVASET